MVVCAPLSELLPQIERLDRSEFLVESRRGSGGKSASRALTPGPQQPPELLKLHDAPLGLMAGGVLVSLALVGGLGFYAGKRRP